MWPFRKKSSFRSEPDTVYLSAEERDNAILASIAERSATQPVILAFVFAGTMEQYSERLGAQSVNFTRAPSTPSAASVESLVRQMQQGLLLLDTTQLRPPSPDSVPGAELDVPGRRDITILAPQRHPYRDRDDRILALATALNRPFRCTLSYSAATDEAPMKLFRGDATAKLLRDPPFNMKPDEFIQHSMLAKSIERAQAKLAKTIPTDPAPHARTADEWHSIYKRAHP